jgi:predicted small metal-binding protein
MLAVQKGGATMRAVLCASMCNCRHTLRAEGDERLVEVALEHLRHNHPAAPLVEEAGQGDRLQPRLRHRVRRGVGRGLRAIPNSVPEAYQGHKKTLAQQAPAL